MRLTLMNEEADGAIDVVARLPHGNDVRLIGISRDRMAEYCDQYADPHFGGEPNYQSVSLAVTYHLAGLLGLTLEERDKLSGLSKAVQTFVEPGPGFTDDDVSFNV